MTVETKKITLLHTQLCPCRSGWMIASCCLDKSDGKLRKRVKFHQPPGALTNFSHPGCYLRDTCNCSEDISREHYVSANVLAQLGGSISISGAPWLAPGQTKDLAIDNLTAKILCKRHNEALSPLDAEAGIFFRSLAEALADLERKSTSRKPNFHLASGTALEVWMLKVACGVYFSVAARGNVRLSKTHTIDLTKIRRALFGGIWDDRGGLYFKGHYGSAMTTAWSVVITPLSDDAVKKFAGVRIALLGLELELLFDTTNVNPGPWTAITRRPSELIFENDNREHHLILTWPQGTPEASIRLGDQPPPGVSPISTKGSGR